MTNTRSSPPKPWIKTPLIHSSALSRAAGCQIYLKLENLQPSGSFKSRGVGNYMLAHLKELISSSTDAKDGSSSSSSSSSSTPANIHFYCSSSGNAGLGCVTAANTLGCPSTVVVGLNTTQYMKAKVKAAGATQVIQYGASWADADKHMREVVMPAARDRGELPVYVPPFDHPEIWNGNATMFQEILAQLGEMEKGSCATQQVAPDAVVCSIGGGGLFCGIMQAIEQARLQDKVKVLAMETKGADSLGQSLNAGEHITLPAITSIVASLGALRVGSKTYEYGQRHNVRSVVLNDSEAVMGSRRFADDQRMLVELSCGVAVAMCYDGRLKSQLAELTRDSKVVIVICGGSNVSLDILQEYSEQFA